MLTGRRPFAAEDMKGYQKAHLKQAIPRPTMVWPEVPAHLDEICYRLLQKEPRERFQSAREILYRLERIEPDVARGVGQEGWEPPMVGRDHAVERVQSAVDALTRYAGGALAIEGPEGCGRSRLLRVGLERASAIGIPALRVEPRPDEPGLPGLLSLARGVLTTLEGEGLEDPQRGGFRAVVEGWTAADQNRGDAVFQLVDGLRAGLERLLEEGPRVIAWDDLQTANPRELDLVARLARALARANSPLLMIFTARGEPPTPMVDPLRRTLNARGVQRLEGIRLGPLDRSEVEDLVSALIGQSPRAAALSARLYSVTQGNPLFVSQFLSSLLQKGVLVRHEPEGLRLAADTEEVLEGHLEIPAGVRGVVRGRLAELAPRDLELLELLATAGQTLDLDLTLEILDRGEDTDDTEATVLAGINHLIARGLAVERRIGTVVLHEVAHRLLADVIYRDMDETHRADLHRRFAEVLARHTGEIPASAELLGHHFERAGDAARAYAYLSEAAARMLARSLPSEAWAITNRALPLEPRAAEHLAAPDYDAARIRVLQVRADVHYGRGEWRDAANCLDSLVELADASGAQGALIRAHIDLSRVIRRLEDGRDPYPLVEQALDRARALHDTEAVALAIYALSALKWEDGDLTGAERTVQQGLVVAQGDDLERLRGELLMAQATLQATQGHVATAITGLEEAESILARVGSKRTHCVAICNLAELFTARGQLTAARTRADQALAISEELGYRLGGAMALRIRGEALMEVGMTDDARLDLDRALDEATEIGVVSEMVATRYALGRLSALQGRAGATEAQVSVARSLARRRDPERYAPALTVLNAWACAMTGDDRDAARMVEAAEEGMDLLPVPRRTQVLLGAARAYAALRRPGDAKRLALRAVELSGVGGFRLWGLDARLLLSEVAATDAEARGYREEALKIARVLVTELGPDLSLAFSRRPGLKKRR